MSSSHEPQQENYYEMKGGFNQTAQPTDEKRGSVEIAEGAELCKQTMWSGSRHNANQKTQMVIFKQLSTTVMCSEDSRADISSSLPYVRCAHCEHQTATNQYISWEAQSEQVSSWVSANIWHNLVLFLYGLVISSLELPLYVDSVSKMPLHLLIYQSSGL